MTLWSSETTETNLSPIVPDGCRDFIIKHTPGQSPQFFISELMTHTRWLKTHCGDKFYGLRLQPGKIINEELIKKLKIPETLEDLIKIANDITSSMDSVDEALGCLSESRSSSEAALELGVSLRTLQRMVKKHTGETPEFWRLLARSRRAAKMILEGYSLLETSYDCHFSDQAHMSREFKRLFGVSPSYIHTHSHNPSHWVHQFSEKGYDTPRTGEQISIKNPLLSVT